MSDFDNDISARLKRSLDNPGAPDLSPEIVSGASARRAPRAGNPVRALSIAGGAGLAVAAITVGALVVAPTINRPPLFTAAAASGNTPAHDAVSPTAESMKIGWWVDYNYTAGAGLSTEGGSGDVYQLVLDGDPEQRVGQIAGIFDVDGTVGKASYSDDTFPTWMVGPEDGTAPTVTVTWSGTGDWWYSDPAASSFYVCDPSVTPEQALDYGCTLPADAPENLAPSEDEARAEAQALLASTGFTVDAADITVQADDWSTTATANLVVAGTKTALDWSIAWSNTGAISWAYGHSVSVESRGSYGTVSATDAVPRLEDGRWWGSAGPDYQGGPVLYAADLKAADSVEPTPIPIDPPIETPETEVVNVTIDTAETTLLLMWDANGGAWLVPGYAMQVDNGGWNSVVSLVEGVIAMPEPVKIDEQPVG